MNAENPVVDLANLREITGGDAEIERMLFEEYLQSTDENLGKLQKALNDRDGEEWARQAHALKGAARNIGAHALAGVCDTAQGAAQEAFEVKQVLFESIAAYVRTVKDALAQESAAAH